MELNNSIEAVAFQTRARTIDHLGREQIADCPTAISELWKNAYDAYARNVALHIFDGETLTATLVDDGHGMSKNELIGKWLVIGTESKIPGDVESLDDRNGLPYRQRQGQKGIGRLSSAALGPLLLVISRRKNEPFVAALIDWRLFENPYLYMQDIEIPVVDFSTTAELGELVNEMFERLMSNVWGNGADAGRDARIAQSWARFDELNEKMGLSSVRAKIESSLINASFGPRQLDQWPVWSGKSPCGTALLVGDISFDLEAQLPSRVVDADSSLALHSRERFLRTLLNFTDPFTDLSEQARRGRRRNSRYSVISVGRCS